MTQVGVVVSRSLEESVLAICALPLPVSRDGGPHPTQHAAPETATHTALPGEIYLKEVKLTRQEASFVLSISCADRRRDDSSPYSAVHQVVPGDHVQEAVQGELVSEQLENRITRVRLTRVSDT